MPFIIGFIAPYKELITEVTKILHKNNNISIIAKYAYLDNAIIAAKEMEKDGVDVIIAREGTDLYLKGQINIPIVPISVNSMDILKAFIKAREISDRIVLANFKNRFKELEILMKAVNCPITFFNFNDKEEACKEIEKISKEVDVLIGGGFTSNIASEYGLKSVLIEVGNESLQYAIEVACNIAKSKLEEKTKFNRISTIINQSTDGIIAVDKSLNITSFNPEAERIFNIISEDLTSNMRDNILQLIGIKQCVESNESIFDRIVEINNKNIIIRTVPVLVDKQNCGAICTLQNVTQVQKTEHNIRLNLYRKGLTSRFSFDDIIGESQKIKDSIINAKKFAISNFTVLITGETGTGKELFAQGIHKYSQRRDNPFVAINCATIPENLLESELFGYEEGSFTGAKKGGKPGMFELAHNGTIFLDEIGDLPLSLQAHLLRVIQEKEVIRLGGEKITPVDVRIISSTNIDLLDKVAQGKFREDLYYRLSVLNLKLPSLRERKEDIPLIAAYNLVKYKISKNDINIIISSLSLLKDYNWKGNIRELENILARITVLFNNQIISYKEVYKILEEMFPQYFDSDVKRLKDYNLEGTSKINEIKLSMEKELIEKFINEGSNYNEIIEKLGISRSTLWRKLKKYGIK